MMTEQQALAIIEQLAPDLTGLVHVSFREEGDPWFAPKTLGKEFEGLPLVEDCWTAGYASIPAPAHVVIRHREARGKSAIVLDPACVSTPLLIHELGHIAAAAATVKTCHELLIEDQNLLNPVERVEVEADPELWKPVNPTPWHEHGLEFIRATIHLVHRYFNQAPNPWPMVEDFHFAGHAYGLSSPHAYYNALGSEVEELKGAPFTVINRLPPPRAFESLFKADTAKFMEGN